MQRISEVMRWGIKSVGGLAANLALLTVWVDYLGIPPQIAIGINWVLISFSGYLVTDRWVFSASASPSGVVGNAKRYLGMQSVMASGKLLNYIIYVGLIEFGVDYRLAWVVGAVIVFVATFSGNRLLWSRSTVS